MQPIPNIISWTWRLWKKKLGWEKQTNGHNSAGLGWRNNRPDRSFSQWKPSTWTDPNIYNSFLPHISDLSDIENQTRNNVEVAQQTIAPDIYGDFFVLPVSWIRFSNRISIIYTNSSIWRMFDGKWEVRNVRKPFFTTW